MRESKELQAVRAKWVGRRIRYFLTTLFRDGRLEGPYTGVVVAATNNEAAIEDRVEGLDRRHSISFTGQLMVQADDKPPAYPPDYPALMHCEIIDDEQVG